MSDKTPDPQDVADTQDRSGETGHASNAGPDSFADQLDDELDMDADLRDGYDGHDDDSDSDNGSVVDQLHAEIERLRAEKDAAFEKMARVQAEYQNSRRRLDTEFAQRLQIASAELIRAILPVIDNFERGLAVDPATASTESILQGLQGVHDQMLEVLARQGVERVSPEAGTPFDPNEMEALMQESAEGEPNHVTRVFQPGYKINGRPLRPAQVAVSK
ncbi:MAG: nucleotide exchange factor GrpE [Phycisphaerae bacterium]